jgi:ligand-binding SRPBCC domain-containing protein
LSVHVLEREQRLPGEPADVFPFFADAFNLEQITPPWLRFRVDRPGSIDMRPGALIEYRLRLHRVPLRWQTTIAVWDPPRRFVDVQIRGPYRLWHHTHDFARDGDGGTVMRDTVRYGLPLGRLGDLAHLLLVRRDLAAIFDFRAEAICASLSKVKGE